LQHILNYSKKDKSTLNSQGESMSKKNYVKLNNNNRHLSLGNLFRILKEETNNKNFTIQSEIFCILFDIDSISDTTVNNYCTGVRAINSTYKNIYV
jgi:hypothetical protein